jgi:hypothetical protein
MYSRLASGARRAENGGRVAVMVAAAALATGCGGKKTPLLTSPPTTAPTRTTDGPLPPTVLSESVRVARPRAQLLSSATVGPGDTIVLLTTVPGTLDATTQVGLTLSRGPASLWRATASARGQTATAAVVGIHGTAITLERLKYTCPMPPAASFCPAHDLVSKPGYYSMRFTASPRSGVLLVANVGPVPRLPSPPRTNSQSVPPYKVTESVLSVSKHPTTITNSYGPSATAVPGDAVLFRTVLSGAPGAPQDVTIAFAQGPAHRISVSASGPRGTPARAAVTSGSGRPITLVLPHYVCHLPPVPTFCPGRLTVGFHHYSVTFATTPSTPITLWVHVAGR